MPWPLFDFAYVSAFDDRLTRLAELAEPENWGVPDTEGHVHPILHSYVQHTFIRVQDQNKIAILPDNSKACFNIGLVTPNQEFIYALFIPNNRPDSPVSWYLQAFCRESDRSLSDFDSLPEMATYFDEPRDLLYDARCELRVNYDHIIDENRDRFPDPFRSMTQTHQLQIAFRGAIDHALKRVRRNYKTAVPQFYQGRLQLLLPISMTDPASADLALAVERNQDVYRAATCLTLEMAYNNARLLARPDGDWLHS